MDICKCVFKFLLFGKKIKFIVILIIFGIGFEVILFVVIFDKVNNCKYLIVDYLLILIVVIVDFVLVLIVFGFVAVDIGMDVLIYVIEVYVL